MAGYLEIAAHSANDMFSKYEHLTANLILSQWEWEILSDCAFS